MTDLSDPRLEVAALRVRIAELEAMVQRLFEIVGNEAVARVMRQEIRREREGDRDYAAIMELASYLGQGRPATIVRRMEALFSRNCPVPDGAEQPFEHLRARYPGGPSEATIRRAFAKFSNRCEKLPATENCAITNPEHERIESWAHPFTQSRKPISAKC